MSLTNQLIQLSDTIRVKAGIYNKLNLDEMKEAVDSITEGDGLNELLSGSIKDISTNAEIIPDSAFYECANLNSVVAPNAKGIGYMAFAYCTNLSNVDTPQCDVIEGGAFEYAGKGAVEFPNVTEIHGYAFYGSGFTSISLPALERIEGYGAFSDSSVTSLNLPSLKYLDEEASGTFEYVYELKYLELPAIETLPDNFQCRYLETFLCPSLKTIGNNSFNYCHHLTATDFSNVVEIGSESFQNNTTLEYISLPSITRIGSNCFYKCDSLHEVTLPESLEVIESPIFKNCTNLTQINIDPNNTAFSIISECLVNLNEGKIVGILPGYSIPTSPDVHIIGKRVFESDASWTELALSDNIITIEDSAFNNCSNLTSVSGTNVTTIGGSSFSASRSLSSVTFPNLSEITGTYAFSNCQSLSAADFPNLTEVPSYTFYNCNKLTRANIPNVVKIGDSAFYNCNLLSSLEFDNITQIGNYAFDRCTGITSIHFPKTLTSIGSCIFCGLSSNVECTYEGTKAEWNNISKYSYWNRANHSSGSFKVITQVRCLGDNEIVTIY